MRIVITGTSGVGKTYLEELLASAYGFYQLPKTTSRNKRPHEIIGQGIKFASRDEILKRQKDYFFCLEYAGHIYCWEESDLLRNPNCTMAITMESLSELLKLQLEFIPILLYLDQTHLDLLENRMRKQLGYESLSKEEQLEAEIKIAERLDLAKSELAQIDKYLKIVNTTAKGKAFIIKDDQTLYQEVVPYILSLQRS